MANDLQIKNNIAVKVQPAVVTTTGYDELLSSVTKLRDRIKTVEVTEDNVKESKKLRAAVNKEIDKLKKSRTAVKSELLTAMDELDAQIKEVAGIATEANHAIDSQIKKLEEEARHGKYKELVELFEKYSKQYDFPKLIVDGLVDLFFAANGQVLNKSIPISKAETVITDFLETVYKDVQTIGVLPHAEKTLAEYSQHLDLQKAIKTIAERVAREKMAKLEKEVQPVVHKADEPVANPVPETVTLTVAANDLTAAIHALKQAGIDFSL